MIFKFLITLVLTTLAFNAVFAKELNVVCSTSDLAWLANKIGKEKVKITVLSDGNDDPHYLDATPKYVNLVSNADVLCLVGLDLEVGWLPKVIQKSGNSKIKQDQIGYCDCSAYVQVLEKPIGQIDRSMGDVHPGGNPHYQLDPLQMLNAGKSILESFIKNQPEDKDFFNKNFEVLSDEITKLNDLLKSKFKDLNNIKIIQYHKEFSYLLSRINLISCGSVEEIPGVSPSAQRIFKCGQECKKDSVKLCLASMHSPVNKLTKFKEVSQIPFLQERISLVNYKEDDAYEKMMVGLADKILLTFSPTNDKH